MSRKVNVSVLAGEAQFPEERAEEAAEWLEGIMESVADAVVNGDAPPEERVPMKADTSICKSWGDKG